MYLIKRFWLLTIGWFYSGWGEYCFYRRGCEVLRNSVIIGGLIVIDKKRGATVILCDDGVVQRGGLYRLKN
jgi:hypothetical protein